jgi:transmembrane sensor
MNRKKNINWAILAKYLDMEINDQEMQLMEKYIMSDNEYAQIIEEVKKAWLANKKQQNMIEVNTDSAWKKLKDRIEQTQTAAKNEKKISLSSKHRIIPFFLRIAAMLILAAGISYILYRTIIQPDRNSDTMTVRSGPDQSIESTLPDGSTILLKAQGKLEYKHQTSGVREVILQGEAYFNVSHNPDEPFIVKTDQALIQVMGTSFCVEVDHDNNKVKVFVESGRVLLSDRSNKNLSRFIEPGFIGIVSKKGIDQEENQNINYLAWKTKKLVFRETRLEDVVNDLNHTFGTNIVYGDTKIGECLFTGTFYNQPVDTLLQVLKTAFNLDIEVNRSEIILKGEGCE